MDRGAADAAGATDAATPTPGPAQQEPSPIVAPKVHLGMELDHRGVPIRSPMKNNPCVKAKEASYKCLLDNNYENAKCESYFAQYRECKKFWGAQKSFFREVNYKAERAEMFKW
eukprot:m.53577 g.53577  ORF g.53577 m.53577 type:complete len:114 (+) comp16678_c0_seq2:237-578(+)